MRVGARVFGIGSAAAGVLDLVWGELEPAHQPLQAWGDHIPGITFIAYTVAIWLLVGGVALLWRSTEHLAAAALGLLYGLFILFPLPRLYTAPHFLGHSPAVYIGVLGSISEQVMLATAAILFALHRGHNAPASSVAVRIARWIVGLCSLNFGLAHLTGIATASSVVPSWMPLGGPFWTVFTGIAFLFAGLALICGLWDLLAARLLGLMFLVFCFLALTPNARASPHSHVAWGGDAYTFAAAGAAWILADRLAVGRQRTTGNPFWHPLG